jgi:putative intracellular protease/amidase
MALSDKKVLMVVANQGFDRTEYEVTRRVLESRGVKVTVAAPELGEAVSEDGRSARATVRLGDVKSWDYDAVVFVGGSGARRLAELEAATKLAKDAEYKPLGALGAGALILARAGVVKAKRVTGDPVAADATRDKEGFYTGQPLEVADKTVTARGHRYAESFGQALLKVLQA